MGKVPALYDQLYKICHFNVAGKILFYLGSNKVFNCNDDMSRCMWTNFHLYTLTVTLSIQHFDDNHICLHGTSLIASDSEGTKITQRLANFSRNMKILPGTRPIVCDESQWDLLGRDSERASAREHWRASEYGATMKIGG
jgi:hypothetical protein